MIIAIGDQKHTERGISSESTQITKTKVLRQKEGITYELEITNWKSLPFDGKSLFK